MQSGKTTRYEVNADKELRSGTSAWKTEQVEKTDWKASQKGKSLGVAGWSWREDMVVVVVVILV